MRQSGHPYRRRSPPALPDPARRGGHPIRIVIAHRPENLDGAAPRLLPRFGTGEVGLDRLPDQVGEPLLASPGGELTTAALPIALAAVGVHSLAMLAVTGTIALVVYQWIGVGFLRRGWINLDFLWSFALVATGLVLLLT